MKLLELCSALLLLLLPEAAFSQVSFNRDGKFKILQLTDLHFKPGEAAEAEKTFARMDRLVSSEKPDFIAVTGDIIFGRPAKKLMKSVMQHLDSYGLPFCVTLGNHDTDFDLDRKEIAGIVKACRNCLNTLDENGELADVRIQVGRAGKPGSDKLDLYFLDSHAYSPIRGASNYAWLSLGQILWMREQCLLAAAENGGRSVPSLAFFHIPLPEFLEAWTNAQEGKCTAVGKRQEDGSHPGVNSGMYAAMLEDGSVMGVFCGHDHDNDFIAEHNGIALAYGRYSGDNTVYNHLPHGARIISLKEGRRAFSTWIREDDGRIVDKVRFDGHIKEEK